MPASSLKAFSKISAACSRTVVSTTLSPESYWSSITLANHVGKKFPLFEGVYDFTTMSAARERWLLERIAVREVWGVGRRIGARLEEMGITTVQALKEAPPRDMRMLLAW